MQVSISDRFPALTPIALRKEKAREVFLMVARFNRYSVRKGKNKTKTGITRKPAGDDWF